MPVGEQPETPARVTTGRTTEPDTLVLFLSGAVDRADIERLCARVRTLLEGSEAQHVVCDAAGLAEPDAATVDALARLQLVARGLRMTVRVCRACDDLRDLLELMGLGEAVPVSDLSLETRRQPEERKQRGGVEEEGDAADPTV